MNVFKKLFYSFNCKPQKSHSKSLPFLVIKKEANDSNIREYNTIEDAISDIELESNVSSEKIAKLKTSLKILKDKSSIKIKNGEIIN